MDNSNEPYQAWSLNVCFSFAFLLVFTRLNTRVFQGHDPLQQACYRRKGGHMSMGRPRDTLQRPRKSEGPQDTPIL